MKTLLPVPSSPLEADVLLSGAYGRIRRLTIVVAVTCTAGATLFFGWRSGLGSALGSAVGYINLVWLHHGSAMMIQRLLAAMNHARAPSKLRLMLSFTGRYVFVIAMAYVILKSFPRIRLGFVFALFLPILAAMCEGVYEACVNIRAGKTGRY